MSHHNDTSVGNGTIVDKSNVKSCADNNKKPVKCKLNVDECISLLDILKSFNAPISEEHVWALCYQCTKCFRNCFVQYPDRCRLVKKLDQVAVHKDGYVHPSTLVCDDNNENWDRNREKLPSERKLLAGLGYIIFQAFDFGIDEDEERAISPQLEKVLNCMIQKEERSTCDDKFLQQQQQRNHQFQLSEHQQVETDDEGIEKDSADCDDELSRSKRPYNVTFDRVLQLCASHVGSSEIEEADQHYRAVCRALVTEALELSSFLQQVSEGGTNDLRQKANTVATSEALDSLNFSDWARLWVQVIRELRQGVNLKKVEYNRAPIEYELTPYEILMEDIRSRRYKLNKVMVDGNIPAPVKKDAHAIILEFIRSRPPLKKASDRKLPPPRTRQISPRERLLESIKQGNVKLRRPTLNQQKRIIVPNEMSAATTSTLTSNGISQRQGSTRRLIKVDYSVIQNLYGEDDENDLDKDESDSSAVDKTPNDKEPTKWPNQNGASNQSNGNSYNSSNVLFRTAYDLATQCPSRRSSLRRHTIIGSTNTAYMPRPHSPTSCWTDGTAADKESNGNGISPEISWSRNSLQDDLFDSKQWQDECLSLTLEEIVHIRSVLTKAELESLPVEGHVKQDVERRKVCFLCLKTRFGLFGPWGNICRLCRRTVCSKCHCKMRIPTEHFAHVPVIALSPTLLSPTDTEQSSSLSSTPTHSTSSRLYVPNNTEHRTSTGSVPNSPRFQRNTTLPADSNMNSCNFHADLSLGPQSLPMTLNIASPQHTSSPIKRNPLDRCKTLTRSSSKAEKLKGLEMTVCTDCKAMVIQIIKASRNNRNDLIDKLIMSNRLVT